MIFGDSRPREESPRRQEGLLERETISDAQGPRIAKGVAV